jgi:hypothetical protein
MNLGETLLQPSDEAVHLGLKRTSKNYWTDSRLQGQNML